MTQFRKVIVIITLIAAFLILIFMTANSSPMTLSARAMNPTDAACIASDEMRVKLHDEYPNDFKYIRSLTKPELILLHDRYKNNTGKDYSFPAIDIYEYTGTKEANLTGKDLFLVYNEHGCYSYTFIPEEKYL